jgi:hypothetical protein
VREDERRLVVEWAAREGGHDDEPGRERERVLRELEEYAVQDLAKECPRGGDGAKQHGAGALVHFAGGYGVECVAVEALIAGLKRTGKTQAQIRCDVIRGAIAHVREKP